MSELEINLKRKEMWSMEERSGEDFGEVFVEYRGRWYDDILYLVKDKLKRVFCRGRNKESVNYSQVRVKFTSRVRLWCVSNGAPRSGVLE